MGDNQAGGLIEVYVCCCTRKRVYPIVPTLNLRYNKLNEIWERFFFVKVIISYYHVRSCVVILYMLNKWQEKTPERTNFVDVYNVCLWLHVSCITTYVTGTLNGTYVNNLGRRPHAVLMHSLTKQFWFDVIGFFFIYVWSVCLPGEMRTRQYWYLQVTSNTRS